jgi:hypothetical protein
MLAAVRACRSILVECYRRTQTFDNINKVLSNSRSSMFKGLSPEQLRQYPIDPCLSTWVRQHTADRPMPRANDADAKTGRNAPQQSLWQLAQTFTVT